MVATPDVCRLHDFAIDVELQLSDGSVAHPNRPRASISIQMIELPLDQVPPPVYAIHDLQMSTALMSAHLLQKSHELIGFVVMTDGVERRQGKSRIPKPDKAVVPVSIPPIVSGSEVVGAAIMAPVSACVRSLSARAERLTIPR